MATLQVYVLTKERDALKRGAEKMTDYGALVREKDGIIRQVMEEGERLSARQGEMEAAARKLRATIRELQDERDK
jgi:TATA element modulatory factor